MLNVEKGAGPDFRANPNQYRTLGAHIAGANKFSKGLSHAIHSPYTHLKIDVEPRLLRWSICGSGDLRK